MEASKPTCSLLSADEPFSRALDEILCEAGYEVVRVTRGDAGALETVLLTDLAVLQSSVDPRLVAFASGSRARGGLPTVVIGTEPPAWPEEVVVPPGASIDATARAVRAGIESATNRQSLSPGEITALVRGSSGPDVAHSRTDLLRDRSPGSFAARLREARSSGFAGLSALRAELAPLERSSPVSLIGLLISFRAASAWHEMIRLVEEAPPWIAELPMVKEQLALALNRRGEERGDWKDGSTALLHLRDVRRRIGDDAENLGLSGRIYKARWIQLRDSDPQRATENLDLAIDAYYRGFRADLRDPYPGINAATLLYVRGTETARAKLDELSPVVLFAANARLPEGDYWDVATVVELSVLTERWDEAAEALERAIGLIRERWEPETTCANLLEILAARTSRGLEVKELRRIIKALQIASTSEE